MFTGIIEQTGTLVSLTDRGGVRRITVEAPGIASRLREGDSLGVSGVCLTALDPDPTYFHADLAQETLDRTSLGSLAPGASVNLELAHRRRQPPRRPHRSGPRRRHRRAHRSRPRDPRIKPAIRPRDHRLDPQGSRPRKRPSVDGPQRLRRRRGHQPHHRRRRLAKRSPSPSCPSPTGAPISTPSPSARQ